MYIGEWLSTWAEMLILTSTALLNNTAEGIIERLGRDARTVILGPSTPMIGEAFTEFPVHMLAGIAPVPGSDIFTLVCHGFGTPVRIKSCHKKYVLT